MLAEVDRTLGEAGISFNTEVKVRMELSDGTKVVRRFDRFYFDPNTKNWVGIEGKGARPDSLTGAQELADHAVQEQGARFEIIEPFGTPPGGQPRSDLMLSKGMEGEFKPGQVHHTHGKPGHVPGPGEPVAMDVATWRAGIRSAHGGNGRPPGAVGYAKADGTFEWVTQDQAKGVAGQPDKNMVGPPTALHPSTPSTAPKVEPAVAVKSTAPAVKAMPTEAGGVPTGSVLAAEAKQGLPPEGAVNGAVVPPAAIRAAIRALPEGVLYAGEAITVAGALVEVERTDILLQQHGEGTFNRGTNAAAMLIIGVAGGVVDDALAAAETGMGGAPNVVMQSWSDEGAGPVQHALGEGYRAILRWGYRGY